MNDLPPRHLHSVPPAILSPAMTRLIDALAQHAVQEHLTAEAAARKASDAEPMLELPVE